MDPAGDLLTGRANAQVVRLADGRVLATGGETAYGTTASAEIWDPATNTWTALPPMPEPRAMGAATLLGDGTVLIAGGYGPRQFGLGGGSCPQPIVSTVRFMPASASR